MAKQKETIFKEDVLHHLKELSRCWFVKVQQVAVRGTPDILACINGHFVALELKTDDGVLDPLQRYTLQKIQKAGGIALVVAPSNFHQVFDMLEAVSRGEPVHLQWGDDVPEPLPH